MGLADLKKNASLCKNTNNIAVSIDDFIAAADLYAAGQERPKNEVKQPMLTSVVNNQSNIIDFLQGKCPQNIETINSINDEKKPPFKRCTFTLSEVAIHQLSVLSQQGDIAKSKLIRQLILKCFSSSTQQQKMSETHLSDE